MQKKIVYIFVVLLLVFISGCTFNSVVKDDQQEVIAGLGRDPGEMYGYGAHPYLTRVLEPLVVLDVENGAIKPGLATNWEVSDDGMTWNFTLRKDVKFHDGAKFDASAVLSNIERISKKWSDRMGKLEKLEIIDDYNIKIVHNEPFSSFLYSMAWGGSAMISPNAIDEALNVIEPIGTGPYIRENWIPDKEMVLVKNGGYWGTNPKLNKITLRYIPDPTTRIMALKAGEIDMIIDTGGILPEQVPSIRDDANINVLTIAGAVPHYMAFNTKTSSFNDLRLRQAVQYAINPPEIIQYVLEGYGEVMETIVPYSEKDWMHTKKLLTYNQPHKAKELLEEAGWKELNNRGVLIKNGEELKVNFLLASSLTNRFPYLPIAEVVRAQLAEVGIAVDINVVEEGLWQESLSKGKADISIRPWAGVSPQTRLYDWLHSKGENTINMGIFYSNATMDQLTSELLKTTNEQKAKVLSNEIQELAAKELPIIPIYDEVLINAVKTNIKGYKVNPWFIVNWEEIYVE